MSNCGNDVAHVEHYFEGKDGGDWWCKGVYPVLQEFGQWVVTSDPETPTEGYISAVPPAPTYDIPSTRLDEPEVVGWVEHMGEKNWVNIAEFAAAYGWACKHWDRGPQ